MNKQRKVLITVTYNEMGIIIDTKVEEVTQPNLQPTCNKTCNHAGRLSNKEWIDFLVEQFDVSRTSARDMLHVMMQVKREDNFKKQFSQRNGCLVKEDGGGA